MPHLFPSCIDRGRILNREHIFKSVLIKANCQTKSIDNLMVTISLGISSTKNYLILHANDISTRMSLKINKILIPTP